LLAEIEKGGGGLLFVDEAYTLNPNEALSQGKQVLDYLLPEMENKVVCHAFIKNRITTAIGKPCGSICRIFKANGNLI
jgi:hypothetical protein